MKNAILSHAIFVAAALGFAVLSCAGPQKPSPVKKEVIHIFKSPKHVRKIGLPPSNEWMLLEGDKADSMPQDGIPLFGWNWKVMHGPGKNRVTGHDYRRQEQNPPLPFDVGVKTSGELRCVMDLNTFAPNSRWGNLWLLGYQGEPIDGFGSLWWVDVDSPLPSFGPIANGDTVALYRTKRGVIALQNRDFNECHGARRGRPYKCSPTYETSVLFVRLHGFVRRPDVDHVIRIPGPIRRHLLQDDDSVLIETLDTIWLLLPTGKEIRRISSRKNMEGAPRSVLLTDDGGALVLTTKGLWKVGSKAGELEKVVDVDTSYTYPSQRFVPVFMSDNGDIYLGLAYFLVRLAKEADGYREEWYVPADCPTARASKTGGCTCIMTQGELNFQDCSRIGAIIDR